MCVTDLLHLVFPLLLMLLVDPTATFIAPSFSISSYLGWKFKNWPKPRATFATYRSQSWPSFSCIRVHILCQKLGCRGKTCERGAEREKNNATALHLVPEIFSVTRYKCVPQQVTRTNFVVTYNTHNKYVLWLLVSVDQLTVTVHINDHKAKVVPSTYCSQLCEDVPFVGCVIRDCIFNIPPLWNYYYIYFSTHATWKVSGCGQ